MSRRRALKAVISTALMAALVLGAAAPASAATLPLQPFAMWPPNFCAASYGTASYLSGLQYGIATVTYSLKAAGSDGACNDLSPAPFNTFAALSRLQGYYEPAGGWVVCNDAGHAPNATGQHAAVSSGTVFGCGAIPHRLWAGSRITYGGNSYYANRYTGSL